MFLLDADHGDDIGVSGSNNKVLMSLEDEKTGEGDQERRVKRQRTCPAYDQREREQLMEHKATTYSTDVFHCILDKLLELIDYVCFAAVCKTWHDAAKDYNHTSHRWPSKARVLPMLLLPPVELQGTDSESSSEQETKQRLLYSVSEGIIYDKLNTDRLSVPYYEKFCGSSHGWLALAYKTVHECQKVVEVTLYITLRNPFESASEPIHLFPYKHCIPKGYYEDHIDWIPKVTLSADPSLHPDDYYVLLAFYRPMSNDIGPDAPLSYCPSLALIKGGQNSWIIISRRDGVYPKFDDAIFYKNKVYLIKDGGDLLTIVDVNLSPPVEEDIILFPGATDIFPEVASWEQPEKYLVISTTGELLLVFRFYFYHSQTTCFRVFKIMSNEENGAQLVEVHCIRDDALFLGQSQSVSIFASKFCGCQPNSIYYATEDVKRFEYGGSLYFDGGKSEMGIFNLGDKTITPLLHSDPINHWNYNNMNIPLWILPSLDGLLGS